VRSPFLFRNPDLKRELQQKSRSASHGTALSGLRGLIVSAQASI
jgi:hypothetical protein